MVENDINTSCWTSLLWTVNTSAMISVEFDSHKRVLLTVTSARFYRKYLQQSIVTYCFVILPKKVSAQPGAFKGLVWALLEYNLHHTQGTHKRDGYIQSNLYLETAQGPENWWSHQTDSLLTLSVQIPPLDDVQTLPSLPGPVSVLVKRNVFIAGSRLQTGWKKVVDWSKLGVPRDSPNISANQRQSFIFLKNHTRESFSL